MVSGRRSRCLRTPAAASGTPPGSAGPSGPRPRPPRARRRGTGRFRRGLCRTPCGSCAPPRPPRPAGPAPRSPPPRPGATRSWPARRGSRCRAVCAPGCVRRRSRPASASAAVCRQRVRRVTASSSCSTPATSQPRRIWAPSSTCALGQQAIGDRLGDAKDVAVCGVQVHRPGLVDPGEATDAAGILLPVGEEPVQQPALVHDLDAARVQAERTDRLARLRVLLQHEHVHVVQPQLAGQHHPRRAAAANDHVENMEPQSQKLTSRIARLRPAP